jgi:hypothetical protein
MTLSTYAFNTDLYITAEDEDGARDALLHWLNEMVRKDDSSLFDLISVTEETDQ